MGVKVREQPTGINSHLPLYGSRGLNSGRQTWQQVPLPSDPACWPQKLAAESSLTEAIATSCQEPSCWHVTEFSAFEVYV